MSPLDATGVKRKASSEGVGTSQKKIKADGTDPAPMEDIAKHPCNADDSASSTRTSTTPTVSAIAAPATVIVAATAVPASRLTAPSSSAASVTGSLEAIRGKSGADGTGLSEASDGSDGGGKPGFPWPSVREDSSPRVMLDANLGMTVDANSPASGSEVSGVRSRLPSASTKPTLGKGAGSAFSPPSILVTPPSPPTNPAASSTGDGGVGADMKRPIDCRMLTPLASNPRGAPAPPPVSVGTRALMAPGSIGQAQGSDDTAGEHSANRADDVRGTDQEGVTTVEANGVEENGARPSGGAPSIAGGGVFGPVDGAQSSSTTRPILAKHSAGPLDDEDDGIVFLYMYNNRDKGGEGSGGTANSHLTVPGSSSPIISTTQSVAAHASSLVPALSAAAAPSSAGITPYTSCLTASCLVPAVAMVHPAAKPIGPSAVPCSLHGARAFNIAAYRKDGFEDFPIDTAHLWDGVFDVDFDNVDPAKESDEIRLWHYRQDVKEKSSATGYNRSGLNYLFPRRLPEALASVVLNRWRWVTPRGLDSGPTCRTKHRLKFIGAKVFTKGDLRRWVTKTKDLDAHLKGYARHWQDGKHVWHALMCPVGLFSVDVNETYMGPAPGTDLSPGGVIASRVGRAGTNLLTPLVREFERLARAAEAWFEGARQSSFEKFQYSMLLDRYGTSGLTGDAFIARLASHLSAEQCLRSSMTQAEIRLAINNMYEWERNRNMYKAIGESAFTKAFRRSTDESPRLIKVIRISHHAMGDVFEGILEAHVDEQTDGWELSSVDWQSRMNVGRARAFLDSIGYNPAGWVAAKDAPIERPSIAGLHTFVSPEVVPAAVTKASGRVSRNIGDPKSTTGRPIPETVWRLALGDVNPGRSNDAEELADLAMRWGYRTLRQEIRIGLEFVAESQNHNFPARWTHEASENVFQRLSSDIGNRFNDWRALDLGLLHTSYENLTKAANIQGTYQYRKVPVIDSRLIPLCITLGLVEHGNCWGQSSMEDHDVAHRIAMRLVETSVKQEVARSKAAGGGAVSAARAGPSRPR